MVMYIFRCGYLRIVKSKYNLICLDLIFYNIYNKKGSVEKFLFVMLLFVLCFFFICCFFVFWEIIFVVKVEEMVLNWKGNLIGDKMVFNVRKEFFFNYFIYKWL